MKKSIVLSLLLLFMATGLFAMDMVIGGGAMYNSANYIAEKNYQYEWDEGSRKNLGGFAFFGINRFFEFNLGYIKKELVYWGTRDRYKRETGALQLGALGKYPIPISDIFVLFPSLGLDYELSFDYAYWHELWFRGGLGLDVFFTEKVFLRGHFNYGTGFFIGNDFFFDGGLAHGLLLKFGAGWMF